MCYVLFHLFLKALVVLFKWPILSRFIREDMRPNLKRSIREGLGKYQADTMAKIMGDANGLPYRQAVALEFDRAAEGHPYWRPPS